MESTFGKCETGICHEYKNVEIVKIEEAVSRANTKRKIRRQRTSYFKS